LIAGAPVLNTMHALLALSPKNLAENKSTLLTIL
jgi:hypothetical protein